MTEPAERPYLSVIIPTLDEALHIDAVLADVLTGERLEVLGVDGGSRDATLERAALFGVRTCRAPAGRARQMNLGAAMARGTFLFFLHADSRLPAGFDRVIRRVLADSRVAAGAFSLEIDAADRRLRMVAWGANLRSRVFGLPYGDQGLFLRASRFQLCGGFPDLPIMEDFVLMRRLRKMGSIVTVPERILTSPRRWRDQGVLRTTLINQAIVMAYLLGIPADRLRRWYRRPR